MHAEKNKSENIKTMDDEIKKDDQVQAPSELEKISKERDEYLNGWKRAKADLINFQKDEGKRFEEAAKFAGVEIMKDLIPVLDSFNLAIAALEREGKTEKGFYMIRTQLEDALRKRGLERIDVQAGQMFNPVVHEAVGEVESNEPGGSVAEIVEQGFILGGKVLKPARVRLAKNKN